MVCSQLCDTNPLFPECERIRRLLAVMSYQEREVTLPEQSALGPEGEVLVVTALHWSGRDGSGSPTLLIVSYINHGIRYATCLMRDMKPWLNFSVAFLRPSDGERCAISQLLALCA